MTGDGHWQITALGRNLTDEDIRAFGATRGFTNDQLAEILPLRNYAVELTYNF